MALRGTPRKNIHQPFEEGMSKIRGLQKTHAKKKKAVRGHPPHPGAGRPVPTMIFDSMIQWPLIIDH